MYKNIYHDRKKEIIHIWDDISGHTTIPQSAVNYAYRKKAGGRFRSMFGDELEKTSVFSLQDPSLFESDVPLTTRVLIEGYYDNDEISNGHNVLVIDIEVDSEGGFPDVDKGDKTITSISLYDKTLQKYYCYILDEKYVIKDGEENGVEYRSFDNEQSLLSAFLNIWETIQPTIVTGWNSQSFDMYYLYNRIVAVLGKAEATRLSPINICYVNPHHKELVCAGVCISLDYLDLYKRYSGVRKPSYNLGAIGKEEIGINKVQYEGNLTTLYKSDIKKFVEYNLTDVRIVVELDKKFNYIDQAREICHFCHVPYEYYAVSSRFLEGAVLTYLKRNNLVACNKSLDGREEYEKNLKENEEGFSGAYVKIPVPGKYDWVYDLDMQSLYPSIIQSLNISPESIVGKIENWDGNDYLAGKLQNVKINGVIYTIDEFKNLIEKNNYSVSSNGVLYSQAKQGIIPAVIEKWIEERKQVRKQAKKLADEGKHNEFEVLNRKQVTLKILANSIYGCLGLPIWRWYNKDNAEATTTTGVMLIQTAGKIVNQYYNSKLNDDVDYVIYSDTDSLFASSVPLLKEIDKNNHTAMMEETLKIATDVQNYINKMLDMMSRKLFNVKNHKFFIKQEMIAESAIWLAKKRYAQWIVNSGGIVVDKMDVKGIDVVRTSFPPRFSKVLEKIIRMILKGSSQEEIDVVIIEFEENLKDIPLIEGAKSTSVKFVSLDEKKHYNPNSRKSFEIVLGSPAQVKAALYYNDLLKQWNLHKIYEPIFHGQKIRFIYLKDNEYGVDALALKADGTDPKQMIEFAEKYVDRRKMYEQELKSKISDFYGVLNWNYPTLEGKKAAEFFSF